MNYLPEALDFITKKDERFAVILKQCPPLNYDPPAQPYIHLMSSIASQQLSTKVARVIWDRFLALFDDRYPHPEQVLQLKDEDLRSTGFSSAKSQYIKNIARHFADTGHDSLSISAMDDTSLLSELTSIKGVGEWTVQMLQIFNLHRPDIWPVKDLGIQQGFAALFNLNLALKDLLTAMNHEADRWKPYRSAASLLIWKWKDTGYPALEEVQKMGKPKRRN